MRLFCLLQPVKINNSYKDKSKNGISITTEKCKFAKVNPNIFVIIAPQTIKVMLDGATLSETLKSPIFMKFLTL